MSEQEIIEGNKLIAEFMESYDIGGEIKFIYTLNEPFPLSKEICTESNILEEIINEVEEFGTELSPSITWYHNSWDWLMPVVLKINTMDNFDYSVKIFTMDCQIENSKGEIIARCECKYNPDELINSVWEAVVEFIKWYNICQKEK